ncbi:helix-turn-helix transcriptional regulator [uncultured Litoreibacter sp.]|uniref:helix-turn-helix domain-containing protein n=1 Tax=uncultured Litoreibacter sp. TaxID=1392394 RepID=UPI00261EAE0F|nr:helix-turn-helix transcriptional regulator [uncultured Litoreibacter sp.]
MASDTVQKLKKIYIDATHLKLREMRESAGLTQIELAQQCGVSARTWAKYENGSVPFPGYLRQAVFEACGHDPQPALTCPTGGLRTLLVLQRTVFGIALHEFAAWRANLREESSLFLASKRMTFLGRHSAAIHSSALAFALSTFSMSFLNLEDSPQIGALTYHEWLFLFCFVSTLIFGSYQAVFIFRFQRWKSKR